MRFCTQSVFFFDQTFCSIFFPTVNVSELRSKRKQKHIWAPYSLASFPIRIPLQWFHKCCYNCPLSFNRTGIKCYVFGGCVCSFNYPACSEHAPYCIVIYGLFGFTVFFHVINGMIFGKTLLNRKCVVIFSTTFIGNISFSEKNSSTYDKKWVLVFM